MATAMDLVQKAASQIGVKESPAGSNNTKYGQWYGMNYEPWCDMFVSWCGNQIGAEGIVGRFAYCPYHVNWFKQRGQWLDREAQPQPGDIIFFANKGVACHVGIVERRNGSSSVTCIEGNTSVSSNDNGGAVMRRERTYGSVGSSWYILGFGRPNWAASGPSEEELAAQREKERIDNLPQALKHFRDLWPHQWYTDAVNFVVTKGYMNGITNEVWGIDQNLTRAQALAICARISNADLDILPFEDIAPWYTEAIMWAEQNGIISNQSENARPEDNCSRAELVTFLWRMKGSPNPTNTISGIDEWQIDPVSWAVETKIFNNADNIRPNDPVSRAEAAVMVQRYCNL